MIHDLLQREPIFRPTAAEILDERLPAILDALVQHQGGEWFLEQGYKLDNETVLDTSSNKDPTGFR